MIQVAFSQLPDSQKEKVHYDAHKNGPEYPGYLDFLNRGVKPMLPFLNKGMKGLDYGSSRISPAFPGRRPPVWRRIPQNRLSANRLPFR